MNHETTIDTQRPVTTFEFGLWTAATLIAGFLVVGLGFLLGIVLAFTRFRYMRPSARWSLAAVGAALVVLQIIGLLAGSTESYISPVSTVQ